VKFSLGGEFRCSLASPSFLPAEHLAFFSLLYAAFSKEALRVIQNSKYKNTRSISFHVCVTKKKLNFSKHIR
jgi:hypothetical protein